MFVHREKNRSSKEAGARLAALKSHNYEEYLRLARNAKDDRLRQLLSTTDTIMVELGKKVCGGWRGGGGRG